MAETSRRYRFQTSLAVLILLASTLSGRATFAGQKHPLDNIPKHFFDSGHFSKHEQSSYSPAVRLVRDDIVVPLGTVAATSFAFSFAHRFLADRLKSNWVNVLGWPLLNLSFHFFMRPDLDRFTALRLLPNIGDAAMTVVRGENWAGTVTPWLRTANTLMVGMEAIWPELKREIDTFKKCQTHSVIIEDKGIASTQISILTCPTFGTSPHTEPMISLDFLDSHGSNASTVFGKSLQKLAATCQEYSISKILLMHELTADGRHYLNIQTGATSKKLEIINNDGADWWTALDFSIPQSGRQLLPILSPELFENIQTLLTQPLEEKEHQFVQKSGAVQQVAGLSVLFAKDYSIWFRPRAGSLLPGTYQPLPEIVISSTSDLPRTSTLNQYRINSLIPETGKLPWRAIQLALMSVVRNKSVKWGEKLARTVEEIIVLPGMFSQIIPMHLREYELKIAGLNNQPEKVSITTEDGQTLEGLLIRSNSSTPTGQRTLHIHYHGNAESNHLSGRALFYALRPDGMRMVDFCDTNAVDVLLPEYRGYRNNLESVNGQTLLDDADKFFKLFNNDYERVTVSAHSLGTGMAAQVSALNNPAATILLSPYTSLSRVGNDMFMGLKIPDWLVKYNMATDQNIENISGNTQLYLRHGADDSVIKPQNTQDLHGQLIRSGRQVDMDILSGYEHNDILNSPDVSAVFSKVLKKPS